MRVFWVGVCVVACCLVVCGGSAYGKEVHAFTSSFGSLGSGAGELKEPLGIAVNSVSHDVYVVDSGNDRVEEFDGSGVYLGEFDGTGSSSGVFSEPSEVAVDNSGDPLDLSDSDVYVVDRGHGVIDKFSASGVYERQLTGANTPEGRPFEAGASAPRSIEGIAVGTNGAVWVSTHSGLIYSFTDELENKYASERKTVFGEISDGLAVDGEDNLYLHPGSRKFAKVDSAGDVLLNPFGGDSGALGVAVDARGGEVYLDNIESVEAFSLSGVEIENFGAGHVSDSLRLAVDESNGFVYVVNRSAGTVSVFESIVLPSVSIGSVSGQQPRSLTLNGSVNPEGSPVTSCLFEYASDEEFAVSGTYAHSVPCSPGALGSGSSPVAVSGHLEGLTPGISYHYRLVAENSAHIESATVDRTLVAGPVVGGGFVTDVASTSATLNIPISPNGADTHYFVEYGVGGAFDLVAPVGAPGVDLGSGVGSVSVSVHLHGLAASTMYGFRFVVVQAGEVFVQPAESFVTQTEGVLGALADGRAWELVSPANKRGALLEPLENGGQVQAASDGSGVAYMSEGGSLSENPAGKVQRMSSLSQRTDSGWSTTDLTLPSTLPENEEPAEAEYGTDFEYKLFSPDLSAAVVEPAVDGTPLLSPEASGRTLYFRKNTNNTFAPLVSPANVPPGTRIEEPNFNGTGPSVWQMVFLAATPDLGHVVFKTPMALTENAIDEENIKEKIEKGDASTENIQSNLYEWGNGSLGLVNVLPDGSVAHGRAPVPVVRLAGTAANAGRPRGGAPRAVSADGRRVAWTWGNPYVPVELAAYRGLFVRDMVEERTVRVGGAGAVYQTMSSDGSKIFYLENGDLHEYLFDTGVDIDLTAGHGSGEADAGVQELVSDVSEDGSYVYFVARGVLAPGGVSGQYNLYLSHETGNGWSTTFIAGLSAEDKPDWYSNIVSLPFLGGVSSRVSPDGRFLVFMSDRSLTGFDNRDAVSGEPDEEVYEYDAQSDRLVCASCDPTGARPNGVFDSVDSQLTVDRPGLWAAKNSIAGDEHFDHWLAGSVPGWDSLNGDPATYQPRYLSDSGRLFFDSPVGLVAQDTNGLEDVYEFEPAGVGGCSSSVGSASEAFVGGVVNGCVGLLSSGTSSSESAFYDASVTGDDVFFDTTSKLVTTDYDKGYDVYDAHVCSLSVPCVPEFVGSPVCSSGDSCKAAPSPQPGVFGSPPSSTFNGVGNIVPTVPVVKRSLSAAQKLARALHACHAKKNKRKRSVCEREARKRYPVKRAGKAKTGGRKSGRGR